MESESETEKVLSASESNDVAYEFTATTFRKTSKLPFADTRLDGTPFVWARSWNHDRIGNEARALTLVAERTTIPVPRVLDHGTHPDGRQYLVTNMIPGITLSDLHRRPCSRPPGDKHPSNADGNPCTICIEQADASAMKFITEVVFPQLSQLRSNERGISGFVMPPSWLSPDVEPPWVGMPAFNTWPREHPAYIFQHGDLAAHNILMDPLTFEVTALIDWEHAGYYPEGMELWPGTLDKKAYYARGGSDGVHLAADIARFLPEEYVERYNAWEDKEQLAKLIETGKIPDPSTCKPAARS